MPRRALKPALLTALFLPAAAPAQEVDCANAQHQQEMNFCAEQDWQAEDAALNAAYKAAMAVLAGAETGVTPSETERIKVAQRAWLAYRDAACDSAGWAMRGGSAEPLLIYSCLARLTAERTAELRLLAMD